MRIILIVTTIVRSYKEESGGKDYCRDTQGRRNVARDALERRSDQSRETACGFGDFVSASERKL